MVKPAMRLFLFTLVIFGVAESSGIAQQYCTDNCEALMKRGYDINNTHTVFLDTLTLSPAGLAAAQNAIDAWNQAFANNGKASPFSYVSNPFWAQIVVGDDASMYGTQTGAAFQGNSNGGTIGVNGDYDNAGNFLKQTLLHEFGHAIGFKDVWGAGCDGQTVMYGSISPSSSSYLTSLMGDDYCDLVTEWTRADAELPRPPGSGGGGYGTQEGNGSDSPIIINFDKGEYHLTGANTGVSFDISATGHSSQIGWTAAGADEAFVCLDRNHDGEITSGAELFGTATRLKNGHKAGNGFVALAEFDDNNDGVIDQHDAIWPQLLLWRDLNHDGISQSSEIEAVGASRLKAIGLDYHWTGRSDSWGNTFRYKSTAWIGEDGKKVAPQPVYDIFFVPAP